MPLLDSAAIERAVHNVAHWGDTDVFPLPFENHVMHDMPSEVSVLLSQVERAFDTRIKNEVIDSYSTLAPVGYAGFRWATQIDPLWNAYLLAHI